MQAPTALLAAGFAVALAACTDAGSSPVAPDAKPAALQNSSLAIVVECSDGPCYATASGGSGEGYSFEWDSGVTELYDADGSSAGELDCNGYWGWRSVGATVRDSNGGMASGYDSYYCTP